MQDYSKILKIFQYICVITSEFDLYNYHLRGIGLKSYLDNIIGGKSLSENEKKDIKLRWKNLGSQISTARMTTRFGEFIHISSFFIKEILLIE